MTDEYYTPLADRAVEILGSVDVSRWEEAAGQMMTETITRSKGVARYTDLDVVRDLGMADGGVLLDKLESVLPQRIVRAMQDIGIDLAHDETKAVLLQLKTESAITADEYDTLIGLGVETAQRFPGLRPGEVQNALQWREEGIV